MHVLVGHHGLFTLTPIWILAVIAMLIGCWNALQRPSPLYSAERGWGEGSEAPSNGVANPLTPGPSPAEYRGRGELPWFVQPLGLALTVVVVGFYLWKGNNYGGYTNGLRWLMWLIPIWLTCLLPLADRLAASKAGRWLGGILLAVSVFSVSYQIWHPRGHPWLCDWL